MPFMGNDHDYGDIPQMHHPGWHLLYHSGALLLRQILHVFELVNNIRPYQNEKLAVK